MNIAEAEAASGMAREVSGRTTRITIMAASEQWERNQNGKRQRSQISESVSALGVWRSRMERTIRQEACKVAQLHQTIDKMARLLEVHATYDETEWLGMRKWTVDRDRMWDARHKDDVLGGMGSLDMATKILACPGARASEREPVAECGLKASKHAGAT